MKNVAFRPEANFSEKKISRFRRSQLLFVLSCLLMVFVFYAVLRFIPIISTFYLSLHRWNLINPAKPFVGLSNFMQLPHDHRFLTAIWNTTYFAAVVVSVTILMALLVAVMLEEKIKFESLFETLYFLPMVVSMVPISLMWKWIYDPTYGALNYFLSFLGISPQGWLVNPRLALYSIMAMTIWQRIGYNAVIFLVGLKAIPREYEEAALVDGCGGWHLFHLIKLPLLMPIVLYLVIMNTIEAYRVFTQVYVMTIGAQGAPGNVVRVLVYDIYQNAFRYFKMGYASAEAVVLFAIVVVISLMEFGILGRKGGIG